MLPGGFCSKLRKHLKNKRIETIKQINFDRVVDTLNIARKMYPTSRVSLDALCKRFKIDNSKRTKHTALIDCELLSKVYINLIDQKEPIFQFQKVSEAKNLPSNKSISYSKKIIKVTKEEIEKHKTFLKKNLKKNYF